MANLYTLQSRNVFRTWLLMGLFLVFLTAIGYVFSRMYNNQNIFYTFFIFSMGMNVLSYWFSDKIVLGVSGARPANNESPQERELIRITETMAITAGLPAPRVYVIDDSAPNAFATGRNKDHSAIAVTTGLMAILDRSELEGVIAHEMAHIGNRDILLSTVIVVLVGFVSLLADFFIRSSLFGGNNNRRDNEGGGNPIFMIIGIIFIILSPLIAQLIQLAISRKREYLADATGALLTRYPEGLASALEKIEKYAQPLHHAHNATAHLFISDPFVQSDGEGNDRKNDSKEGFWSSIGALFLTHPPIKDRVAVLRGMKL